jgi:hypothetical protein
MAYLISKRIFFSVLMYNRYTRGRFLHKAQSFLLPHVVYQLKSVILINLITLTK